MAKKDCKQSPESMQPVIKNVQHQETQFSDQEKETFFRQQLNFDISYDRIRSNATTENLEVI